MNSHYFRRLYIFMDDDGENELREKCEKVTIIMKKYFVTSLERIVNAGRI